MVKFYTGTFSAFENLAQKDSEALYVLDNHQVYKGTMLLGNVHTVENTFPASPTDEMIENYYISLTTGEIKYVDSNKNYINISQLMVAGVTLNSTYVSQLIAEMAKTNSTYITMPTLSVDTTDAHKLNWNPSNVESFTAITIND